MTIRLLSIMLAAMLFLVSCGSSDAETPGLSASYWTYLEGLQLWDSAEAIDRNGVTRDVEELCRLLAEEPDSYLEILDLGHELAEQRLSEAGDRDQLLYGEGALLTGAQRMCPDGVTYALELGAALASEVVGELSDTELESVAIYTWSQAAKGSRWPTIPNAAFGVEKVIEAARASCAAADELLSEQDFHDRVVGIGRAVVPDAEFGDQLYVAALAMSIGGVNICPEHLVQFGEWASSGGNFED